MCNSDSARALTWGALMDEWNSYTSKVGVKKVLLSAIIFSRSGSSDR